MFLLIIDCFYFTAMLYCEECEGNVPGGLDAFQRHLKDHKAPFICVNESCWNDRKLYSVKSSFIRHLEAHHARLCAASDEIIEEHSDEENGSSEFVLTDTRTEEDRRQNLYETSNESLDDVNQHETNDEMDASQNDEGGQDDEDPVEFHTKLEEAAALLVLNLWRHGNVPGVAISRVMTETTKLMNSVVLATQDIIISNLRKHGVPEPTIVNSVQNIYIHDPFIKLKSMDNQLDTFEELFALVKPERKPLGRRLEDRIDRHSRLYLPVDVAISFQYVSVIKTLTVILNNPVLFKLIHEERPSTDGNLRSYLDASACRDHPLIKEFPHTLRLVKWMDDSEVVNAQGAKTSIHKIVADCFIVQNLPYEENSRLRSIHLSSYAYREDLPEGNGTDALLDPFFAELEKLESPDGVTVTVNGQPFVLRATLIAFAADALAAHELLGLMSTSCNRICSQCLVHKQELYQNILATGKERTRDMHAANLQELHTKGAKIAAISSGVKRLSTLVEKSTHAVFPEAMIKDPMHDFLRGIVPMEIKLVLHHYVVVKKYFEIEDFNAQLKSFAYGPADMKNKPSPNFTLASLQKPLSYVMHQSASQAWCLLRVFPFIISVFPKVPENCPHLRLLVLLKRLLDVVLSTVISPQDLDLLDQLTEEHHLLFFSLYPPPPLHQQEVPAGQMQQQDANEDSDDDLNEDFLQEEEDDPDDSVPTPAHENPAKKQKKKEKVVRPLFKHHYSLHYRDFIERYGPSILYWCMR